jgi:hypothetical protein
MNIPRFRILKAESALLTLGLGLLTALGGMMLWVGFLPSTNASSFRQLGGK